MTSKHSWTMNSVGGLNNHTQHGGNRTISTGFQYVSESPSDHSTRVEVCPWHCSPQICRNSVSRRRLRVSSATGCIYSMYSVTEGIKGTMKFSIPSAMGTVCHHLSRDSSLSLMAFGEGLQTYLFGRAQ